MTDDELHVYRCTECGKTSTDIGYLHAHAERHRGLFGLQWPWNVADVDALMALTEIVVATDVDVIDADLEDVDRFEQRDRGNGQDPVQRQIQERFRAAVASKQLIGRIFLVVPLMVILIWQLKLVIEAGIATQEDVRLVEFGFLFLLAWATLPVWSLAIDWVAWKIDQWWGVPEVRD